MTTQEKTTYQDQRIERDVAGRFLPGSVPNPTGRPRGAKSMTTILREIGWRKCSERKWATAKAVELGMDPATTTIGELVAEVHYSGMVGGEMPKGYASVLAVGYDRMEGKPTQRVEVSTDGVMAEAINGKADDLRHAFAELDDAADPPALPAGGSDADDLAGS